MGTIQNEHEFIKSLNNCLSYPEPTNAVHRQRLSTNHQTNDAD